MPSVSAELLLVFLKFAIVTSHPINTAGTVTLFTKKYASYAHYPELCLSWIDSLSGDFISVEGEKYRKLFINCPVDVIVFDSTNQIVAQIQDDIVQTMEDGVVSYIDDNSQKVIILPTDENYTIKVNAKDSGMVTYTVTEYNMDSGSTEKVVSYYKVDVKQGDTLTGTVENLDRVPSANYPLTLNSDTLTPSITLSGSSVKECNVTVTATGNGTAIGGGNYVIGEFTKVTARANGGATFLGWYVDSVLASTDAEYRFLVDKDITITARFSGSSTPSTPSGGDSGSSGGSGHTSSSGGSGSLVGATYAISVNKTANGTVTVNTSVAYNGNTVTLTVKPDAGYELDSLIVADSDGKSINLTDKGNGKYTFIMPASKVSISASFQKIEQVPGSRFYDVPNNYWAFDAIEWVCANSYMNGITTTAFNPDGSITRQQIWMILARLSGQSPANMAEAKAWAVSNGISDGTNPGNAVTRQQMVTFLYRYCCLMGYEILGESYLPGFPDINEVSDYARESLGWATNNSIVEGTSEGLLNPVGTATRAQFAVIIRRFYNQVVGV